MIPGIFAVAGGGLVAMDYIKTTVTKKDGLFFQGNDEMSDDNTLLEHIWECSILSISGAGTGFLLGASVDAIRMIAIDLFRGIVYQEVPESNFTHLGLALSAGYICKKYWKSIVKFTCLSRNQQPVQVFVPVPFQPGPQIPMG